MASAPGPAGVAVFRVSGAGAAAICRRLTGRAPPAPRRAVLRRLFSPSTGAPIDDALTLFFLGPASYTGEDVLELHCHGGVAVRRAVLRALSGLEDARAAVGGEFTRRALAHDKIDLSQAEAVAALVEAETETERKTALRRMDGEARALVVSWRERLLDLLAAVEAEIDFGEEEEPPEGLAREALAGVCALEAELEAELSNAQRAEARRGAFDVVLMGPPNAGKSTLFNALARREAAIVSATPGATRDVLELDLEVGDARLRLADTAGLRESDEELERIGVERARARAARADLALWLLDADAPLEPDAALAPVVWRVWAKADKKAPDRAVDFVISAEDGQGVAALAAALADASEAVLGAPPLLGDERHREAVANALLAVRAALATGSNDLALLAEALRSGVAAFGEALGEDLSEAVLDRVFSRFCIGK